MSGHINIIPDVLVIFVNQIGIAFTASLGQVFLEQVGNLFYGS